MTLSTNTGQGKISKQIWGLFLTIALMLGLLATPSTMAWAEGETLTPEVTAIEGLAVIGENVIIRGSNLSNVADVKFGSTSSGDVDASSSTVTVEVPSVTLGLSDVRVIFENEAGDPTGEVLIESAVQVLTSSNPSISSISPRTIPLSGNQEIVISGTNFIGASDVKFGSASATAFRIESSTRIVATAPEGSDAGSAQVVITTGAGESTSRVNLNYAEPCEPGEFLRTSFQIRSSALTKAQRQEIRSVVDEMVLAECPAITLQRYGKKVTSSTPATERAYIALSKSRADAVAAVVAKRLGAKGSTASLKFAKFTDQISQSQSTNLDGRKSYRNVRITNSTSNEVFVSSVWPAIGSTSGGDRVIIKGANFEDVSEVRFGQTRATSFQVLSENEIEVIAPALTSRLTDITVTADGDSVTKRGSFRFAGLPMISSISAPTDFMGGGKQLTITGSNFFGLSDTSSVRFGSVDAVRFTVDSPSRITVIVPQNTTGSRPLRVSSAISSDTEPFTYEAPPVIESITPAEGSSLGGTNVVISGFNFEGVTSSSSVMFGAKSARSGSTYFGVTEDGLEIEAQTQSGSGTGPQNVSVSASTGKATVFGGFVFGAYLVASAEDVDERVGTAIDSISFTPNSQVVGTKTYAITSSSGPVNEAAFETAYGLDFTVTDGVATISGTPTGTTAAESWVTFTVTVTGSTSGTDSVTFRLRIRPALP